jgi:CheY-like chemotaxis protein
MHKILVVPQTLLQLELGSSFLDRQSLTVRATDTAEAALQVVGAWQPALVIFSSALAGQHPARFCERARAESGDPPVRLLMLSDQSWASSNRDAPIPCDAHLLLPVGINLLLRTVAGLLSVRERRAVRAPLRVLANTQGLVDGQPGADGALVNTLSISEVGLLVEAPEPLTLGASGTVALFLPGSPERLTLRCGVQYIVDETQLHYALSILEPTSAEQDLIRNYTERHLGG